MAQIDYDLTERVVIGMLREARPDMDLRIGTALRDLVVRPTAQLMSAVGKDVANLDAALRVGASSDNALALSVLSNYNISPRPGGKASGVIAISVSRPITYLLGSNFTVSSGASRYTVDRQWYVVKGGVSDPASETACLSTADGASYFLLPVTAESPGAAHNRSVGEALVFEINTPLEFTSASVYSALSGGEDAETPSSVFSTLPAAMAHTAMCSEASVRAVLTYEFPHVRSVSCVGAGDEAMLRDRRNPFNWSTGGRVDVYVRTHTAPESASVELTGVKVSDGVYSVRIPSAAFPGYYRIKLVTSPRSVLTPSAAKVVGSYLFTETRFAEGIGKSGHDMLPADMFQTVWQAADVIVRGVGAITSGGVSSYPGSLPFLLVLQGPKGLSGIQDYIDDPGNAKSLEADVIVRGGVPCFVSIYAEVRRKAESKATAAAMQAALAAHVNSLGFGSSLSVSQLASVLHGFDVESVSFGGDGLSNSYVDAEVLTWDAATGMPAVRRHRSPELVPSAMAEPTSLLSPKTLMFVCDPDEVFVKEILL